MKRAIANCSGPGYPTLVETRRRSPAWLAAVGAVTLGTSALTACPGIFPGSTAGDFAYDLDAGADAGTLDASVDGSVSDADVEPLGGEAPPEDAGS